MVFQIEKKFQKFPKLKNFKHHQISIIDKLLKKLANFFILTICKTIKITKISKLMVNYQIQYVFWVFDKLKKS